MLNNTNKIISTFILLFTLITIQCSDSPTSSVESITVNLPMKKKTVHAIAYYSNYGTSDSLEHLRISSFYFDSTFTSNDTTYLLGIYERLEPDFYDVPISGSILISLTNDWVFYQSSEIIDAGIDLIKPLSTSVVDTTSLPTDLYSYSPIFPRTLIPNSIYSIYRPANEGDGWGYSGVYREFNVKNVINWKDQYGSDLGFEVIIKHVLFGFTIMFNLIIDKHGIVNSQSSFTQYKKSPKGAIIDSMLTYTINRRIIDFTNPTSVRSLSYYANEVREKGLRYNK